MKIVADQRLEKLERLSNPQPRTLNEAQAEVLLAAYFSSWIKVLHHQPTNQPTNHPTRIPAVSDHQRKYEIIIIALINTLAKSFNYKLCWQEKLFFFPSSEQKTWAASSPAGTRMQLKAFSLLFIFLFFFFVPLWSLASSWFKASVAAK